MKSFGQKTYQFSQWLLLIILLLVALVNIGGRILLANAELFRSQIEQQLADYGIRGVVLDNISARWQGLQPVINIEGGSLSIPGRSHALSVSSLELRVQLFDSLARGELVLESFYSHIAKLVLVRDKKGDWWLNDIPLSARDSLSSALDIYVFFQRLPTFVDIDIGLIQLRDLRHGVDYLIQQGRLRSSRKQSDLSLELTASLPSTLGKDFQLILKGDAATQQLYVEADQLNLRQLLQLTLVEKKYLRQALLDFRSWIDLDKFRVTNVINRARVSGLEFDSAKPNGDSYGFSLLQSARHDDRGWNLSARLSDVKKGAQSLGDYKVELMLPKDSAMPGLWLDHIELSVLNSVLQQFDLEQPLMREMIASGATGRLDNITARLDLADLRRTLTGFDFTRVSMKKTALFPGVSPFDGRLLFDAGKAQVELSSRELRMDFGGFFRAPLNLGQVRVKASAGVVDGTWLLQVSEFTAENSDVQVSARMWMEKQDEGLPYLFIRSQYRNGDVTAVHQYLPVSIMPPGVVNWLDRSLQEGMIKQGDFLFHGRLKNPSLLQEEGAGLLLAAFDADKPKIDYLEGWPVIDGGHGHVEFINAGLKLSFSDSWLARSQIERIDLEITDFFQAGIKIDAQTRTRADVLVDTLQQLPILEPVGIFNRQARRVSGQVDSLIHIEIPLADTYPRPLKVTATADLTDVAISVPEWMIELEKVNGTVDIDNDHFQAKDISALYFGESVTISLSPDAKAQRTDFHVSGKVRAKTLLQLAPEFLHEPAEGTSNWVASVSLAHEPSEKNPLLRIAAQSALEGTVLNFPQPFNKSKEDTQLVRFNADLFPELMFEFKLDLPGKMKADGRVNLQPEVNQALQFLTVGLQENDELAPVGKGITIAGHAAELDIAEWFEYINLYFPQNDVNADPFLKQVNSVDLSFDRLWVGKQQARQAKIKVYNDGKALKGNIDSSLTSGLFTLPYRMSVIEPLVAQLNYIKLEKTDSKQEFDPKIGDMPNLFIKSQKVSWEKMEVYDFLLSTRNEGNTFVIEQLDFSRDQVKLKSSGHWEYQALGGEHVSVFNIDIKGRNFGKAVKGLGLGETIQGGKVDFNGQIGWGGALFNINWPTLIGEVNLTLRDGYLKSVDPGAGRFVGLLSFSALPKRLFLDFGDVVKEGMQFDSIKGRFTIRGETMYTDNASMDSVSATVKVKGETNLRRHTYDQTMIITPKIGDTLPVLGALTAGNAVGWGLLLLQKIFKKPIDKSVQIEYKVSGSWEDPKIDLVAEKKLKTQVGEEDFYGSEH